MTEQQRIKLSKFLSLVLRHQPETIGINLDSAGWVAVDVLLEALQRHCRAVSPEDLREIVATSDKKRFAFSPDGKMIRASQGHSVEVDLAYEAQQPPELLYHGTATRFLDAILTHGLVKQNRHHVHLSPDRATAVNVGQRHGKPVVLVVRAGEMHREKIPFYLSANGVWLVDAVPAKYLSAEGHANE
jgi:putative RNA 2'-phosphotransferase